MGNCHLGNFTIRTELPLSFPPTHPPTHELRGSEGQTRAHPRAGPPSDQPRARRAGSGFLVVASNILLWTWVETAGSPQGSTSPASCDGSTCQRGSRWGPTQHSHPMPLPGGLGPPSVGFVCQVHDFHLFSSKVPPKLYMGQGRRGRKEKIKPLG